MFKNYLKVAIRYLSKHKGYTFINIAGLSLGVTCCILMMLFVRSEWSYDRFHSKSDRIYRAWLNEYYQGQVFNNTITPLPLGALLQDNLPEIETTCRVFAFNSLIKSGKNEFSELVNMVDSSFFNLFDFELMEGNRKIPFSTANSIIITQATAKKYFGNENPAGKNLELQLNNQNVLFTVGGIIKDIPVESSIQFGMLIPFSNAFRFFNDRQRTIGWSNVSAETYVLLKEGTVASSAAAKIPGIMQPLVQRNYKPGEYNINLQPITDIHLNNALPAGNQPVSNPKYSYILSMVAILLLIIACINFVTLAIGRSTTRAMEIGVRKVLGARRSQLIRQYWGEALLLTLIALVGGVLLSVLLLKPFNQLAGRELFLRPDAFTLIFCLLLVLLIGLVAGIYPALVLSGFKPIHVLKGRLKGVKMGNFRKSLVIGQFAISIIMVIVTIAVTKQLNFMRQKDLGYNKEHIVIISTNKPGQVGNQLASRFKTAISANPQVLSTTNALYSMAETGWMTLGYTDNSGDFRQFRLNVIDDDFIKTTGLQLIAGRGFSGKNPDDSNAIIVNETLVKEYNWKDPIGKTLPGNFPQPVIGVVKDFHFESLHTNIKPLVLTLKPDSIRRACSDFNTNFPLQPRITVKLGSGNVHEQIEYLKTNWKSVAGDQEFQFRFLDDALATAYQQEKRLQVIVRIGSLLSIVIACLGLFGLATLVVVRRTKEIGIRKVLGANVRGLVTLIAKEFALLVGLASLIAFPIAWLGLKNWQQDFAYRTEVSWWIFLAAGLVAMMVALFTVSIHAIKAALTNPVKSLRTE